MPSYRSEFVKNPGSFLKTISNLQTTTQTLLSGQTYSYQYTTGLDGTVTVDYSALKLTEAPRLVIIPRLGTKDDPVFLNIVGDPTKTTAKIIVRRISSIIGLLPSYVGVSGVKLDVLVRAVAVTA